MVWECEVGREEDGGRNGLQLAVGAKMGFRRGGQVENRDWMILMYLVALLVMAENCCRHLQLRSVVNMR